MREFINTFLLLQLKKYTYHKLYVDLLSKSGTGKDCHSLSSIDASPQCFQERRDYAEGLKEEPNFQVQNNHYGSSRICHIEGSFVDYQDKEGKKTSEFYSHFSDNDCKQAAYINHQIVYISLDNFNRKEFSKEEGLFGCLILIDARHSIGVEMSCILSPFLPHNYKLSSIEQLTHQVMERMWLMDCHE